MLQQSNIRLKTGIMSILSALKMWLLLFRR
jgi:hypothetical protein